MSTISGLLLRPPEFAPFDLGRTLTQATNIQGGQLANQTSLLQLEEMRRAQEEAAMARQFMAANPGQILPGGGGSPLLASPALTAGGGGPMPALGPHPVTQQTVVPGQPPGAPQPVPGGQDLSRFATGGGMPGGPPQSTIGGLQPQPDPLQGLMARSPGAALQVMQTRMKIQEQQLTWGLKSIEAVAQLTHGVKNQEDLDRVRAQMQPIAPQAAAQLPQFYSAEALEAFQEKALGVKERQELKIKDLNAQSAAVQAQAEIGNLQLKLQHAGYQGLSDGVTGILKGLTPEQVQEFGGRTSDKAINYATQRWEENKLRVSREQGAAAEAQKPLGETQLLRFNTLTQAEDTVKKLATEFTPAERKKFVGMGGMTMGAQQLQQLYADATGGKADPKFARFAALVALAKAEAFSTAGKALTETESGVVYGYIPTGKEYSAEEFEQKLQLAQERVPSMLDRELKLATTPRSELPGMRQRGELGATPRQPTPSGGQTSQAPPGGKVLTEADITTTMQTSGKSREEVLAAAKAKGYTLR